MLLRKILTILVVMVMGYSFNPIQENDWQALNILLEKLSVGTAEAGTKTKKTGSVVAKKARTVRQEASSSIETGQPSVDSVPIVGYEGSMGVEVYANNDAEENVTMPENSVVYKTQAKIAVPSSYFLDLRGIYKTTTTQQYTADLAILHDANGNTVTLANLDETNNVGTAGPIAGGRDQSGAFDTSKWIHFFFIYNPVTGDVSSLSSASPTAPTLPTGYTFFVRTGAVWFSAISQLLITYQMGDRVTYNSYWPKWDTHATGVEAIDLANYAPATAKLIHGHMGLSAGTAAKKMYVSAVAGATMKVGALCDAQGTGDSDYGVSGSKDFTLPLLTAQTIWWATETTGDIYAIGITGYTDDL